MNLYNEAVVVVPCAIFFGTSKSLGKLLTSWASMDGLYGSRLLLGKLIPARFLLFA